jgi:hypothetical protein
MMDGGAQSCKIGEKKDPKFFVFTIRADFK